MIPITSLFEITKRSPRAYKSLVAPLGAAAGRGIAYIEDPANPGNAILADGSAPFAGFVTRPILVGGPTLADAIMPNRIELPFQDGQPITMEYADEVQAEGYDPACVNGFLYSGTGASAANTITSATQAQTKCTFMNGQFAVAASGDWAEWTLAQIMPQAQVQGNVRARFTRIEGVLMP